MESNKVDVYIASLWRGGHVVNTINSLLRCPELTEITVVCNNYTKKQIEQVRKEVDSPKLTLIQGFNEKGCSEKLRFINSGSSKYIALCDDDLIYPANYLTKMIEAADNYKCLVSAHGRVLKKEKATNYYLHKLAMYHCLHEVVQTTQVDIAGSGVCLFARHLLPNVGNLYRSIIHPNMTDIYLSSFCLLNGVARVVVRHQNGWIKCKEFKPTEFNIYQHQKNNCEIQTEFINKLFLGYE
jgi:hypothetical protein